ncbi:hypothetical protein A1Q2_02206 [Trichosporon asahii var. asahii CBS 8904]|uniref:Uncharacterized protein n=1 Tax=Trichosporon asahii var. asahii (strain CBS 8904) TaxID=1220162 RepID=K1W3M1_TRIAC|nr:hypothetical protein A1Q2_02206 [Trichosporon asahii var. asahii CBS 8904]
MFSVLRSTRLVARPLVQRAPRAVASLHASARVRAAADPFNDPQIIEMRAKIQNHEGTKAAIQKLGELMQAKGVDISKPPSAMQMMKLGMDPEIREAGQNMQEAGVNLTPEVFSKIREQEEGNDNDKK